MLASVPSNFPLLMPGAVTHCGVVQSYCTALNSLPVYRGKLIMNETELASVTKKSFSILPIYLNGMGFASRKGQEAQTVDIRNISLWSASTSETNYESLKGKCEVDAVVVGGGITGLTAAYLLKKAGKKVAVIEKSRIATGESGQTTSHTTEVIDSRYETLISHFGKRGAATAAESSRAAIQFIENTARELKIDCEFKRVPAYLYAESKRDVRELKRELEAMRRSGIDAQWVDAVPIPVMAQGAIRVEGQAQFHPRKYLLALAQYIHGDGSFVFERSRATEIKDGEPCEVHSENGQIIARDVIVATNSPVSNRFSVHTKIAAYRTYAIAFKAHRGPFEAGLFWDNREPYHYTRFHGDYLIVGGEDHKTGMVEDTEANFKKLEDYCQAHFGFDEVAYRWSGQVLEPVDGLPFIGRNVASKHQYIATGYSGNGMTFGTLGGMITSDLVLGLKNPWASLYQATRFKPLSSVREFVMENKDYPTCMIKDRVLPAQAQSIDEVKPGEGKLVEIEGRKVAVYHDDLGAIQAVSPVCPHMGCLVHFNKSEKTWDCPCHGSRFDTNGRVLNGPAVSDLEPVAIATKKKRRVSTRRKKKPGQTTEAA